MILGTNKNLFVANSVDSDLDLEISIPISTGEHITTYSWIGEKDAQKLIDHLCKVFELIPNNLLEKQ